MNIDDAVIAKTAAEEAKKFIEIYGKPAGPSNIAFDRARLEEFMAKRCKQYIEFGYKLKTGPAIEEIKQSVEQGVSCALNKILSKFPESKGQNTN